MLRSMENKYICFLAKALLASEVTQPRASANMRFEGGYYKRLPWCPCAKEKNIFMYIYIHVYQHSSIFQIIIHTHLEICMTNAHNGSDTLLACLHEDCHSLEFKTPNPVSQTNPNAKWSNFSSITTPKVMSPSPR